MKLPVVAVSAAQMLPLYQKLYALGWRAYDESAVMAAPYPNALIATEGHQLHQGAVTHVALYNGGPYPWSFWTCGPKRRLDQIIHLPDFPVTLVNSSSHLFGYLRRHGLGPPVQP